MNYSMGSGIIRYIRTSKTFSKFCAELSFQVEMVRAQSTNQFIGSITTVAHVENKSLFTPLASLEE